MLFIAISYAFTVYIKSRCNISAASNLNPRRFLIFSSVLTSFCTNLTTLNFCWLHNQVSNNGWAEGECRGKAGWFPYEFIEKRERVLASKVAQVF